MMIDWTHIGPSVTAAFLGSLVEFIEALTIVLAVGTVRGWRSAMLGTSMGVLLGRPMARVTENTLKFAVGILISAFGVFWVGEGLGFHWPGSDLSIFGLTAGFLLVALIMVPAARRRVPEIFAPAR